MTLRDILSRPHGPFARVARRVWPSWGRLQTQFRLLSWPVTGTVSSTLFGTLPAVSQNSPGGLSSETLIPSMCCHFQKSIAFWVRSGLQRVRSGMHWESSGVYKRFQGGHLLLRSARGEAGGRAGAVRLRPKS